MNRRTKYLLILAAVAFSISTVFAQEKVHKVFSGKEKVKIESVSGDVILVVGSGKDIIVDLEYDVSPKGAFEPEFVESGSTLKLKEDWNRSSSGRVTWNLTVPVNTEIEFNSASGDISITGLKSDVEVSTASGDLEISEVKGKIEMSTASGDIELDDVSGKVDFSTASGDIKGDNVAGEIDISTASGDIDLSDVNGEVELSTASGDIKLKNSSGEFELSCASGDIKLKKTVITGDSEFSTASGDIEVSLDKSSTYNLELSAASGDVVLDYNGNTIDGYFEFTAKKSNSRISAPFSFDREEEFERNGRTYLRKSFTKGGANPKIKLSTSSGKAELKK